MSALWEKFTKSISRFRVDDLDDHSSHTQNLYDTIDDWDAVNVLGRAYTIYHPLEPRYLIWFFLISIPIVVGFMVAFIDQTLTALFRFKHDYIAHNLAVWAGADGGKIFLCAIGWGSMCAILLIISFFWSKYFAYGTAGRGLPRVLANLNGVYMPHWQHFRVMFSKIFSVIITVLSGVPYDFIGNICEIGAMIGAVSLSRNPMWQRIAPFTRYFRNGRDSRLITSIGIAAAASAAFRSPIGGLALLLELSAVKFNIKFLYRVFLACNLCGFVVQLIYTHIYGFEVRESAGQWAMLPLSQLAQVQENLLAMIPCVFLGVVGGLFQGVFAVLSNIVLNRPALKTIQSLALVAFIYGVVVFVLAGVFGLTDQCRPLVPPDNKYDLVGTPAFLHSSMFCSQNGKNITTFIYDNVTNTTTNVTSAPPVYVNAFASLTLGFDSSILRILFRRKMPQFWTPAELGVAAVLFCIMLPFLTVLSIVDGDVLMPTGLLGAIVGQLVYAAAKSWGVDAPWVDGGLFALLGAVSFIGGMTRLTFSLTFLFVDFAGDVRHVLFIMMAISIARAVADRVAPVRIDYIVMKYQGFAILDFALKIEKYDSITLHEFQQKEMKVIPPTCTVAQLIRLLRTSFHNAFPVIDPHSQKFIGLVHRRTLMLIVWAFSEKIPPEFQHPRDWPGLVPNFASSSKSGGSSYANAAAAYANATATQHNYGATGPTLSSAIHSFKMDAPGVHNPRGQYESFFAEEDNELRKGNQPQSENFASSSPSSGNNSPSKNSSSPLYSSGKMTSSEKVLIQKQKEQQHKLTKALEDYDHFDAYAACLEYHRLRDLDDFLHVKFAEDDATLFQFAHGIRIERSVMHQAFVEETNSYSEAVRNTQVNLVRYTDRATFTVRAAMCVSRLYNMFTVLGLRHAVIVDYSNRPTGLITRRDLMTYKIIEKKRHQNAVYTFSKDQGVMTGVTDIDGDGIPLGDESDEGSGSQIDYQKFIPGEKSPTSPISGTSDSPTKSGNQRIRSSTTAKKGGPNSMTRFYDADDDDAEGEHHHEKTNFILPSAAAASPVKEGKEKEQDAVAAGTAAWGDADDQNNVDDQNLLIEPEVPRTPTEVGSPASAGGIDAFEGKVLYQVNRMRPPMLLPRGWNGSGAGGSLASPKTNTASASAAAANKTVASDKTTSSDSKNSAQSDGDSVASYKTIVSEPET